METSELLKRIVDTAADELEKEDQALREAVESNSTMDDADRSGILRFNNEHYYKFVVARGLLRSMPYRVEAEREYHDLMLTLPQRDERVAVIEMKRWMSKEGREELSGIRMDIEGKLAKARAAHRLMLIFSANPVGGTEQSINWLRNELDVDDSSWHFRGFPTRYVDGAPVEFWVGGYAVPSQKA